MPFPRSPFNESFNSTVLTQLNDQSDHTNNPQLKRTLEWLCTTPEVTSYRVNTLKATPEQVRSLIQAQIDKIVGKNVVQAEFSLLSSNIILFKHLKVHQLPQFSKEVIIDADCAAAVLRGAHIYAPGVLGMQIGSKLEEFVSIYADISGKCLKGFLKKFEDNQRMFIGNGVLKMTRDVLFGENLSPKGVAVQITETISGCLSLGNDFLPPGWALLQNIPSILCVEALLPQAGDRVLDMCASPGHKTTHIAALMCNQGVLVALDKTPSKIKLLQQTCDTFGAKVKIFKADSCKILNLDQNLHFVPESFDKILLDVPCSALGKRPQLSNKTTEKVIKSYVPLQRRLFSTAVKLLVPNGRLVYSTCTITLAENEGIVAWALKTFPELSLVNTPGDYHQGCGWGGSGLSLEDLAKVKRFGPDGCVDSVGFFMACFTKC